MTEVYFVILDALFLAGFLTDESFFHSAFFVTWPGVDINQVSFKR